MALKMPIVWFCTVVCASAALLAPAEAKKMMPEPPPVVESVSVFPGFWEAEVTLPKDQKLAFSFVLTQDAGGQWTGQISIPAQMVEGMALSNISLVGSTLRWSMPLPGAPETAWPRVELDVSADQKTAKGSFTQGMMAFTLTAKASDIKVWRPQTPAAPFPYTSREVTFENAADPADKIKITGTLTIPAGAGPHPVALLVTGSGAQDRDETVFGHKPFWVIADHLSRNGIAVLRVDDRGVGGTSPGDPAKATTTTFATDAAAGLDFLKTQPEIDPKRIGVIGHSEGGTIAILLAAQRTDLAFAVLLAGSALPGFDILLQQNADIARAQGVPEDNIKAIVEAQRASFTAIRDNADISVRRAALREVLKQQFLAAGPDAAPNDAELDAAVEAHAAGLESPWMKTFLVLDPRESLSKITTTPVLALNGTLDTQVAHEQNLAAIREGLTKAGNPSFETHALPKLNHLFQTATTGHLSEYSTIRETFAPAALDLMTAWISARVLSPK